MKRIILFIILLPLLISCKTSTKVDVQYVDEQATQTDNGIYFWKSQFKLNDYELQFLEDHNISRLYVKMFDVALQTEDPEDTLALVPIATTRFVSPIPEGVEVVPVVYITYEAISHLNNKSESYKESYVKRILHRIDAMASFNEISGINEVQFDCDWTESTLRTYRYICNRAKGMLNQRKKQFSITLRLHQMNDDYFPEADRGVLMLYNTGSFKNPDCVNSILTYNDAQPYIRKHELPFPVDYAYPTYSWNLLYRDNEFKSIARNLDLTDSVTFAKADYNKYVVQNDTVINALFLIKGDMIRHETSDFNEIERVKSEVSRRHNMNNSRQIIYHLDSANLSKYTDNEIKYMLMSY